GGASLTVTGGGGGVGGAGAGIGGGGGGGAVGKGGSAGSFGSLSNAGKVTFSGTYEVVPVTTDFVNTGTIDLDVTLSGSGTIDNHGVIIVASTGSIADTLHSSTLTVDTNAYKLSLVPGSGTLGTSATNTLYVYAPTIHTSVQALPTPTAPMGDIFAGWFTAMSGGTPVTDTTMLSALGAGPVTMTLYAQYKVGQAPGAPTIGTATAGNASATVTFTVPSSHGSRPITGYTVTAKDLTTPANGGQTAKGTAGPITVRGLTNGDSYTFTVTATNTVGTGPSSGPSNAVTPSAPVVGGGGGGGGTTTTTTTTTKTPPTLTRLAGPNRIATAIAISAKAFPVAHSASAVVLARADAYPDALAGGPLAVAKGAPLLLSEPDHLDPATLVEIQRVLVAGGRIYLLGGSAALNDSVASALGTKGFSTTRLSGPDRFATAVAVAVAISPDTIFEASGVSFPDALSASSAAAGAHGAILLTNGATQSPLTSAYLSGHTPLTRYTVGGPAASADTSASALVGADRFDTAVDVAKAFFSAPKTVGLATGVSFPDALAADPLVGTEGAPILLVNPTGVLPASVATYLRENRSTITSLQLFGGSAAVSDAVAAEAVAAG
ncbi:MAG: cell wall-binding repeat-containing protein, partial [Acidimicrobiales bacterium]